MVQKLDKNNEVVDDVRAGLDSASETVSGSIPGVFGATVLIIVGSLLAILIAVVIIVAGGDRVFPECQACQTCPECLVDVDEYTALHFRKYKGCLSIINALDDGDVYGKSRERLEKYYNKSCL